MAKKVNGSKKLPNTGAQKPKPWSPEGRSQAAVARVKEAIREGKMAESMHKPLPKAPQLLVSAVLLDHLTDWDTSHTI